MIIKDKTRRFDLSNNTRIQKIVKVNTLSVTLLRYNCIEWEDLSV